MDRSWANKLTILLILFSAGVHADNQKVSKFFQNVYFIPVHINGGPQEYTLVTDGVRLGRFAFVGGKYVGLPLFGLVIGAKMAGVQVDWGNLMLLTTGYSAIIGTQGLAINAITEPVLVLMSPQELEAKFKENSRFSPAFYFLNGVNFGEKQLLKNIIKGRHIRVADDKERVLINRLNLDGKYVPDKRYKWLFQVNDMHGLNVSDGEAVSLAHASCGNIFRRILSAIF